LERPARLLPASARRRIATCQHENRGAENGTAISAVHLLKASLAPVPDNTSEAWARGVLRGYRPLLVQGLHEKCLYEGQGAQGAAGEDPRQRY
jgi:hypothetical protein